jgi:hypothetical protein
MMQETREENREEKQERAIGVSGGFSETDDSTQASTWKGPEKKKNFAT